MSPEQDARAAEYALRLLDGDEVREAEALERADPAFAAAVAAWEEWLAALWNEVVPVEPGGALWPRISAAITPARGVDNVVALRRKVGVWRALAAAATALAASLALVIGFRAREEVAPSPSPSSDAGPRPVLATAITPTRPGPPLAVASYDRPSRSLLVTPATLSVAPGRTFELWVISASGTPRSLGILEPGPARRIVLADALAARFLGTPTLAISDERAGGSRTGLPEGAVVATGKLLPV